MIITIAALPLAAQNTVTFKVNLTPQLEDSIFVPGRDIALLQGNLYPLTPTHRFQLTEGSEIDSIYTVDVNFPLTAINKELKYTFILKTPEKEITEMNPRFLRIKKGDRELDALYFDTFAW
ncbi:MAG: hypothetical protein U5J95_05640 [Balneolaceae bacterium]|nr:hypothetical protein [Balneolaceae bacterium]